jgi:hypothetical protein
MSGSVFFAYLLADSHCPAARRSGCVLGAIGVSGLSPAEDQALADGSAGFITGTAQADAVAPILRQRLLARGVLAEPDNVDTLVSTPKYSAPNPILG